MKYSLTQRLLFSSTFYSIVNDGVI